MKYFYAQHFIDKNDKKFVQKALENKILSQGKYKFLLEKEVKKKFKSKYAIAMSNASNGLHLAYKVLGLKKGDYIITTPLTWTATVSAALRCQAKVELIDIDPKSLNMDLDKLEKFLKHKKKKPKIIVPVHYAGNPIDLKKLKKISDKYKIKIVEDAAQAMGAKYNKHYIGDCRYSDIVVFSMHPAKTITTGEGGLVLTNQKNLFDEMTLLMHHGISKSKKNKYPWSQNIIRFGYNYKISEINCALGLSQLKKINDFVNKKNKLKKMYIKNLSKFKGTDFQIILKNCTSSNHLFPIMLKKNLSYDKKLKFYKYLKKQNIYLTLKYLPIHMNSFYKKYFKNKKFENTELYFKRAFNLPISYNLNYEDVNFICRKIIIAFNKKNSNLL